ncbi:MAG TPA: HD domain-containing phosphohydrolase [Terriglobia bacterium]|nr:HD domain-containing phosphohydrolase [Terriglobia bacterium]
MLVQEISTLPAPGMTMGMDVRTERGRVLIVDDEPGVCDLLSEVLYRAGFQCLGCLNGEEGLEAIDREKFDVVITDLRMPGISGLSMLERARQEHPETAFLVVTVDDDVHTGVEAMKQGATDYLVKPLHLESVVSSVKRAMQIKRLELDLKTRRQNLEREIAERTQELHSAIERVEQTHDEMIEMLGAALDARDDETAGHALRVTRYALEIAKVMGCPKPLLDEIVQGSFLHDIGKIGIPDAILLKPAELTPQERGVMHAHVEIGYDLVRRSKFMAPAAEIVLNHHERFDGMGYPRGLKGEAIPLGGRIFAVADTLDAMTSDRPYRKALPFEVARAEIIFESGRQFDPKVVQAFLSIPEHVLETIRRESSSHWGGTQHDVPKLSLIWQRWGKRAG